MKKLVLTLSVVILAIGVSGQNSPSDKLYANLDGAPGVTILSLSKNIIDMIDMVVENDDAKQVTGPLEKVKLVICKKDNAASSIRYVEETFGKRPFDKVEKEMDATVFIVRKGRGIKECHVINDETSSMFVLSFYGNFKIEDIDKLAKKAKNVR